MSCHGASRQSGAGALFFLALVIPLLAVLMSVGIELTSYFSALEYAQTLTDEAVLRAEPHFPNASRVTQSITDTINAHLTSSERLSLAVGSVTLSEQSVRAEINAEFKLIGLGLMGIFTDPEQLASMMRFSVISEARPQSLDVVVVFDGWRNSALPSAAFDAPQDASTCGQPAVSSLRIVSDVIERLGAVKNHRIQVVASPYGQQVFTTFALADLASELENKQLGKCLDAVSSSADRTALGSFSEYLLEAGPQAPRPDDGSFLGFGVKEAFTSGDQTLTHLKDPIKHVIMYVPLFGQAPLISSAQDLASSVSQVFSATELWSGQQNYKVSLFIIYPQGKKPLSSLLTGVSLRHSLEIKVLDAPSDLPSRTFLSQLISSSLHSGVLSK